jgi:SOS-response transcriptional repressor LexA
MPDSTIPVVHFKFHLKKPVIESLYQYITSHKKTKSININSVVEKEEVSIIDNKIITLIPLYNFYAAAGTFSEMQSEKDFTLIEGPENINPNNDYFACKIVGESMNRVIPNGSICLFKPDSGGSRNGKIVLVENIDVQDQDFNSSFTIKTYSSEKIITEDSQKHISIVLRPNSSDDSYKNLIINEENASGMRVVGIFVKILKSN